MVANTGQDNGAQVAIQTIYRELDRARFLVKKHAKQDEEHSDGYEDDWTMVDEDDESGIGRVDAPLGMSGTEQEGHGKREQ